MCQPDRVGLIILPLNSVEWSNLTQIKQRNYPLFTNFSRLTAKTRESVFVKLRILLRENNYAGYIWRI
jgi:hypothetical protein